MSNPNAGGASTDHKHGRKHQGSGNSRGKPNQRNAPGLAPRKVAANLISQIISKRKALETLLEDGKDSGYANLQPQDKALARAIASTTLRHFGEIQAIIKQRLTKSLPASAPYLSGVLYTAVAQIMFMDVADHAAVSLAVDAAASDPKARHFKPLVNGVLRSLLRERDAFEPDATLNTPDWLRTMLVSQYGADKAHDIMLANMQRAALDLTVRADAQDWATRLNGTVVGEHTVRLDAVSKVFELDGFKTGDWWVQDAAASVPATLLMNSLQRRAPLGDLQVLDACAAPGGKTAQLAAAGLQVTALDLSEHRVKRLAENLDRLNLSANTITADLLTMDDQPAYDAILLDAPCSATGTIRRHPDVAWLKTRAQIKELVTLQRNMLAKAARLLKPGGTMIYCTCSLLAEEGEAHLDYVRDELGLVVDPVLSGETKLCNPLTVADGVFRSTPDMVPNVDGFFILRLMRP